MTELTVSSPIFSSSPRQQPPSAPLPLSVIAPPSTPSALRCRAVLPFPLTTILHQPEYLGEMHPPLTLHRHPMCAEIIEQFQKCHLDHPIAKFFGECTDLKIKLDHCFRQEKALRRKANFEESKKLKERLKAYRKENAE